MSAAVKCTACNDAGSLPGSHDLDCASCGVAVERVVFEAELPRIARAQSELDTLWGAYQMGKAAGAAQAVPAGWISIDERLPEEWEEVVVVGPAFGDPTKGRYVSRGTHKDGTFYNEDGDDMHPPTHYISLPKAT